MNTRFQLPGRWLGAASLVLGPLLLLIGVVLRLPWFFSFPPARLQALQAQPTFFPLELAAAEAHPTLMNASYGAFLAGNMLLWPAVVTVSMLAGQRSPRWAWWGGALALFGLFARTFHAGVDHFAFQLIHVSNLQLATDAVAASYRTISYGPFDLIGILGFAVLLGWPILAIAAYRAGTLGLIRCVALGLTGILMAGVLKGGTIMSVIATAGLCVAFVPLGLETLWRNPEGDSGQ